MPDPNENETLAARMAQVAAAAKGGERVIPSTGEVIEEKPAEQFGTSSVAAPEYQQEQRDRNDAMSAAVDAMPIAEPVAEVIPEPEPIRVEVPPPTPEPEPARAEEPKAAPEIEQPRTADAPYAASSMGQVIDMMERGGFSQECVTAFQALARGMSEIADATQKKQKGSITLKITLTTEGEAFFMEGDYKVTAPKLPRPRTIGWQTDDGRISPTQPRQQIMFGREVGDHGERGVRHIGEARVVRTV